MSKRKESASAATLPLAETDVTGLRRVTRALKNVTRVGAAFASGACDRAPFPGIAFKNGDKKEEEDELLLPLRKQDALTIKARGKAIAFTQHGDNKAVAWEVNSDALEIHNPRWREFLDERLAFMRGPLGISSTAAVEISLSKMRLVEAGAPVYARGDRNATRAGRFGTLVVVLPGAFVGGVFTALNRSSMQRIGEDNSNTEDLNAEGEEATLVWWPGMREYAYDLSYAAFYDHCSYIAEPVEIGTALCLVYDLLTTNPTEIPLFAGAKRVQDEVAASLSRYLDVAPAPLAKRYKISPDAWRTINEYGAERHFVHLVESNAFEDLDDDEQKIAQSLATFCAQSAGQYMLYLAGVLFSKKSRERDGKELKATLKAPWIQSDEIAPSSYPPIFLRNADDLVSHGRLEDDIFLEFESQMSETDAAIVEARHRHSNGTAICTCYALVVQPASIQVAQIAKQPIGDAVAMLRSLLLESRDKAVQHVRRIVFHRSKWRLCSKDMAEFSQFVEIVVEINNLQLFFDVLGALNFDSAEKEGALSAAVLRFGWDTCVNTLVKCILSMPTLRSRVNFVVSFSSLSPVQIGRLLDALVSLYPWTESSTDAHQDDYQGRPKKHEFQRLLVVAQTVSQEKLEQVAAVTKIEEMVKLVVPALTQLIRRNQEVPWLQLTLRHVWGLYEPMLVQSRDEVYAAVRIRPHCDKCSELQSFMLLSQTETTMEYTSAAQRAHIESVLSRVSRTYDAYVQVRAAGDVAVRITKTPGSLAVNASDRSGFFLFARREEMAIRYLLGEPVGLGTIA